MLQPPPLRIHRMIDALMASPDNRARFLADPETLFEQFGVAEGDRAEMRKGTRDALDRLGVHPSMQFKFLIATGRSPVKPSSFRWYLDKL
jgi:hypothetical protein